MSTSVRVRENISLQLLKTSLTFWNKHGNSGRALIPCSHSCHGGVSAWLGLEYTLSKSKGLSRWGVIIIMLKGGNKPQASSNVTSHQCEVQVLEWYSVAIHFFLVNPLTPSLPRLLLLQIISFRTPFFNFKQCAGRRTISYTHVIFGTLVQSDGKADVSIVLWTVKDKGLQCSVNLPSGLSKTACYSDRIVLTITACLETKLQSLTKRVHPSHFYKYLVPSFHVTTLKKRPFAPA